MNEALVQSLLLLNTERELTPYKTKNSENETNCIVATGI